MQRKHYQTLTLALILSLGTVEISEAMEKLPPIEAGQTMTTKKAQTESTKENTLASNNISVIKENNPNFWGKNRPSEKAIEEEITKNIGKQIAHIEIVGAGEATFHTAKEAITSRLGDSFSRMTVEKDLTALYDTGYFYDIYPVFQQVPEGVIITYRLLENPVLTGISITGNTVETSEDLAKLLTVKNGEVLNTKILHENLQAIEGRYRADGYILVKLNGLEVKENGRIDIVINEGILEGYSIKGNTKTKDKVILREMRMQKGEPFNANKARRSLQRVYNLGFFEDVNMKLNPGREPNAVVMEIDVIEKRTGTFAIGAGYSSQDGMVGMISLGDTNFRGMGDTINIQYEFSGEESDARGYTFSYTRPWLDQKQTALSFRIYNRRHAYDDYNTNGDLIEEYMRRYSGGEVTVSRPMSEYSTNYLTLRNRKDIYVRHSSHLDRSTDQFKWWRDRNFGLTRSLIFEHVTDTRDNIYYPFAGARASLSAEFTGFGGNFSYQKYTIEDQQYFRVGHAQVIAIRGKYGHATKSLPEISQYKIGGQNTLRGYRDDEFRGDSMALLTLEYRFPIVNKVKGALFADSGAAWFNGWRPKNPHASIGAGLQLETPVGPIRLDYGHGSQGNRFHFSVGGMF